MNRHRSLDRATFAIRLFLIHRQREHVFNDTARVGEQNAMNFEVDLVHLINGTSVASTSKRNCGTRQENEVTIFEPKLLMLVDFICHDYYQSI